MRKIGKGYNVGAGVVIVIMLLTGLVCADALRVPINEEYSRMENLQKIEEISDALKKNTPSGGGCLLWFYILELCSLLQIAID